MSNNDYRRNPSDTGEASTARRASPDRGAREYRRAFIILRPAAPGWSGHVRLERRTMTGSMYFIVNAPQAEGALNAALVGQRGGAYYAAPLGALKRDDRGQQTLARPFDPRQIEGRPLEAYALIAVAQSAGDGCRVVLTGNVDGARPMDPAAVREAVCALYLGAAPAADLPDRESVPAPAQDSTAETPVAEAAAEVPATVSESPAAAGETSAIVAETPAAAAEAPVSEPVAAAPAEPATAADAEAPASAKAAEDPASEAGAETPAAVVEAPTTEAEETAEPAPQHTRIYTRMRIARAAKQTAEQAEPATPENASADATSPPAEAASSPADTAPPPAGAVGDAGSAPAGTVPARAIPLEDGYVYGPLPLPAACGMEGCLLGLRAGGDGCSARVAFPGAYAPEPPKGLSGSVWLGPGDSGTGYWVRTIRL